MESKGFIYVLPFSKPLQIDYLERHFTNHLLMRSTRKHLNKKSFEFNLRIVKQNIELLSVVLDNTCCARNQSCKRAD